MTDTEHILFSVIPGNGGDIGCILLNRPQALNALTVQMCTQLMKQLQLWAENPQIKAIIIKGAGDRAFCAGGDLKAIYEAYHPTKLRTEMKLSAVPPKNCSNSQEVPVKVPFFWEEYTIDETIFHFPKPYISFLDGITMGGGVGVSVHGSHPIATERLVIAMPETSIGFFPDVGVAYFLTRLPHRIGYYLALTGARLSAVDATAIGIIPFYIPSHRLPELELTLAETPFSTNPHDSVTEIVLSFTTPINKQCCPLISKAEIIERCFSAVSIEAIIEQLLCINDSWSHATINALNKCSPTSLKVTWEHFKRCEQSSMTEILQEEKRLAQCFINSHDFFEGIRAVVIDKSYSPHWQPSELSEVNEKILQTYFPISNR